MTSSTSEAMRLIKQGGVKIDSEKVEDPKNVICKGQDLFIKLAKENF